MTISDSVLPSPAYSLSLTYNPPGIAPGKGGREVHAWIKAGADGSYAFQAAQSQVTTFGGLLPYSGKDYLYETSFEHLKNEGLKPELVAAADKVARDYQVTESSLAQGEAMTSELLNRQVGPLSPGLKNGTWELSAWRRDDVAGEPRGFIFSGKIGADHAVAGVAELAESLMDFTVEMRKKA